MPLPSASNNTLPQDAPETEEHTSAPAAAPAAPATQQPVKTRLGFDPLRPVRYLGSFIGGTVNGLLNGLSSGVRKGVWVGVAAGILLTISGSGIVLLGFAASGLIGNLILGAAAGGIAGGAIGTLVGGLTGGAREVHHTARGEHREIDPSNQHAARPSRSTRGTQGSDYNYNAAVAEAERRDIYNFDRLQQQERENIRDYETPDTSWQDRIDGERAMGVHQDRGL